MNKEVSFLLSRFPTYRTRILEEYDKNEDFKALCDDFYSSAQMLQERQRQLMIDTQRELEYRRLFLDLEQEMVEFLYASKGSQSPILESRGPQPYDRLRTGIPEK